MLPFKSYQETNKLVVNIDFMEDQYNMAVSGGGGGSVA